MKINTVWKKVLLAILALCILWLGYNIFAISVSHDHYRMTFGSYNRVPDEWQNTTMETSIMMGKCGLPFPNGLFESFFARGYLYIQNTTFAQYEEYFERYGEGPQITLTIEQDDDHVRMEYAGYGVLADGTKEEVHDVLDFSATWPWIALGQMPTLEHS